MVVDAGRTHCLSNDSPQKMLVIVDDGERLERRDDPIKGDSLQARFEAMRQRRIEAQKRVTDANKALSKPKRSQSVRDELRAKFVEQAKSYLGVPYSAKASGVQDAPLYLDCCNLVRRCLLDLRHEFGFKVGHWNQSYQFDTLPIEVEPSALKPGDLIFWSATYNDSSKKPRKHDMVHVEIWLGGESGEATLGSRSTDPESFKGVAIHQSYKSYAENCTASHGHKLHFRSIDTWLDGVCVSHCKECTWAERPSMLHAKSAKYSLFATDESDAKGNDENCVSNGDVCRAIECVVQEDKVAEAKP